MAKKKLRVLYISPLRGGIGNWSRCLIEDLDRLADVELVTFRRKREMDDKNPFTKIKEEHVLEVIKPSRPHYLIEYNNKKSLNNVIELTKRFKPDVVHLVLWAGKQILWFVNDYCDFLKKQGVPVLMTIHDVYPHISKSVEEQKIYVNAWKKANMLVLLNKDELKKLKKFNVRVPVDIIPHGIYHFQNKNRCNKKEARMIASKRIKHKIKDNTNVVLFFGYIRDYKGLMYLIKAAPAVLKVSPNTLFLAVGTMELAENPEKYQAEINKMGIGKNFVLCPTYINNPELYEAFYKCCDLNVLPYLGVSASGALFSVIGMKRPVVISEIGTFIKDLNKEGLVYVIKPGDVKSLEKAIIKILKNKKEASKKALKAYLVTKRDYNWKGIAKKYYADYEQIIQKRW